ncbi:MAG: hypothetical protein ACD_31C00008G0005 [uncultured bacterium]|uniref:Uncharacterized protein n=1 Tax=Candidatus Daviesbacteria bacterium GW2011_GWB1_36_5 TaxID=1618426 RepID=A0A0G0HBZ1_9BACT|nr:MAG: hypothetical protein ACD_31C00008G0005 [uncultured bacterium]KKQ09594.1 MAG: hypothetical protein US19_C0012G0028 [Candidatus Daviesbacteria bacterium GW2011_GWB1_36_5]
MKDILTTEDFPGINWSQPYTHEDGYPASSYGVIGIDIGTSRMRMDYDHKIIVEEVDTPLRHSRLRFGYPKTASFTVRSTQDTPFNPGDSQRINQSVDAVQAVLTKLHQRETAQKVDDLGDQLKRVLRTSVGYTSQEHLQDIGVLEDLLERFRGGLSI